MDMKNDLRVCSNCNESARLSHSLVIQHGSRIVGVICPNCQQAKKIQLTLKRENIENDGWHFLQYFPLEG